MKRKQMNLWATMAVFSLASAASAAQPTAPTNTTQNVNVVNTPTVNVGTLPAVNIGNTPAVTLSGTPTVNIGTMPAVSLSGTPSVTIGNTSLQPVPVKEPVYEILDLPFDLPFSAGATFAPVTASLLVAAGKRLVIENVSTVCQFSEVNAAYFEIMVTTNGVTKRLAFFPTTAVPMANGAQTTTVSTTPIRLNVDQGSFVAFDGVRNVGGAAAACKATILGYYAPLQ